MRVFAFHGQFANGRFLREDMGDPDWVTDYPDWQQMDCRQWANLVDEMRSSGPIGVVAYSLAGKLFGDELDGEGRGGLLTALGDSIAWGCSYECPPCNPPPGRQQWIIAWNDDSFGLHSERAKTSRRPVVRRRYKQALQADIEWLASGRIVLCSVGSGRHTRKVEGRKELLGLGHNWDKRVSKNCKETIFSVQRFEWSGYFEKTVKYRNRAMKRIEHELIAMDIEDLQRKGRA